jgi:hypothetical protein
MSNDLESAAESSKLFAFARTYLPIFISAFKWIGAVVLVIGGIALGIALIAIGASGAVVFSLAFIAFSIAAFVFVSTFSVISIFFLGVSSYRKHISTIRRRNAIVFVTALFFLLDRYVPNAHLSLLPFEGDIDRETFWGLISIFVIMQLLGYVSFIYEDGLRYNFNSNPSYWDYAKSVPSVLILFIRDFIVPVLLTVSFLWKYGGNAPEMVSELIRIISDQLYQMVEAVGFQEYLAYVQEAILESWDQLRRFIIELWPGIRPWLE